MFMGEDKDKRARQDYFDRIHAAIKQPSGEKPWTPTYGTDRMAQSRDYRGKGPEST